jgi:hypothetical protein
MDTPAGVSLFSDIQPETMCSSSSISGCNSIRTVIMDKVQIIFVKDRIINPGYGEIIQENIPWTPVSW